MKTFLGLPNAEMKLAIACVVVLVVLTPTAFSADAVRGSEYVLENASTRLVVKDNRVVSLLDKVRSIEHVSPQTASAAGMFSIQLVKGIQPTVDIDATQMVSRAVRRQANALELEFSHKEVVVRTEISLSAAAGGVAWSISAAPSSKAICIGSVACPVFETPVTADGTVRNCLLPLYEGRLHPLDVPLIHHKPKTYPSTLFAQMVACLGPAGGFLLWCDDTAGHVKEFKYRAEKTAARFSLTHRMPYAPGKWTTPYHTRISFSGPSWYEAAEIYRKWAADQPWCGTKFRDREDMPAFLHRPHFHSSVQLSKETDLQAIPSQLADLSRRLNAPVIVRGTYWEKRGGWVGIDYFPPIIGEEGLRSFAEGLRAQNIMLICEIAGYRWMKGDEQSVVINQINKLSQQQREELGVFFRQNDGAKVCEMGPDGKLNPFTTICRGSPFGKTFLPSMAARLFDLGITSFDSDSDVGPSPDGVSGCFNPAHGHPIPCGSWSTEDSRTAFREIRAEAARRGIRDFFLVKEHCTELLNMEVHAYLSRLSLSFKEPYVVPLTQYLYHEYLPVVLYNSFPAELNDIIIFGQIPGGSPLLANQPVLADYYQSMQGHAKPFLLYGRMLRPLMPGIPGRKTTLTDKKSGSKTELTVPLVRQSAWEDGAGNIGLFAINTEKEEMTVDVPSPVGGPGQATFYLGASRQDTQTVTVGKTLKWRLPPGRLAAIVFKPESPR